MRLVYRDKGCAVCLAAGIQAIYKDGEDSNRYEGAHIINFAYHDLVSRYLCNSLLPFNLFHHCQVGCQSIFSTRQRSFRGPRQRRQSDCESEHTDKEGFQANQLPGEWDLDVHGASSGLRRFSLCKALRSLILNKLSPRHPIRRNFSL
jgi:hypothetical protein